MKIFMTLVLVFFSLLLFSQTDMQKYLSDTREMVKEKNYPEALERYIWFHNHALEFDRAMAGVRLSFALSDWLSLAAFYPPAMTALVEIRDKKSAQILDNQEPVSLFRDVAAINRVLNDNSKTIELLQSLILINLDAANTCWISAKDQLYEAKEYDIINIFISSPLLEYSIVKENYDRIISYNKNDNKYGERIKSSNEKRFVKQCIQLMQLSYYNNDEKSAKEIHSLAASTIEDTNLRVELDAALNNYRVE